ncbi:hypothetical protein ColKHC_10808 [Colletotrichum higginsianum]|nr:hypothetical protein ColKHC_10808 [Colletotrichum higginsianum]
MVEILCFKQAGAPPSAGGNHGAILLEWRGEGTNALPDSGQSMAKSATVHGEKKKKKKQHTSMRSSTQSSFLQLVVPSYMQLELAASQRRLNLFGVHPHLLRGGEGETEKQAQDVGQINITAASPHPSRPMDSVTAHLTTRPDAFTQTCIPPPLMQLLHHGMSQEPTLPGPA